MTAIAHGAWTRLPNGESTDTRQSPSSSLGALDHDRAVVGHDAGRRLLVVQVLEQVGGGHGVQAVLADEARRHLGRVAVAQLAGELADGLAELDRPARALAPPERHLAGLARRRRDQHAVVGDLLDAPARGAEQEGLAGPRLEDHLLVELADAGAVARAVGEEDAVEAAVGNGAGVADRHPLGALAGHDRAVDAVPGDPRPQLGELVRGIAARQHVEHAVEHPAAQLGERRGAAHRGVQVVDRPVIHRRHRHDLLRQHVERVARIARRLDQPLGHRPGDRRAGQQVAAELREDDPFAGLVHAVAGAADALQPAGHRRRRLDLHHQVDGAHVDAQLERRGRHQRPQPAGLEQVLDLGALRRARASRGGRAPAARRPAR